MTYVKTMTRLLMFDLNPLNQLGIKQVQSLCILNVGVLGLVYGYSAAFFSSRVLIGNGYDPVAFNALKIIVSGLPAAFFMHAGAALFIWVFLKAIGGKSDFIGSYFHLGVASISLWPLAPFAAALQTGIRIPVITGLALCLSIYAFGVTVRVIQSVFKLPHAKMVIATSVTMVYIISFLYLWT